MRSKTLLFLLLGIFVIGILNGFADSKKVADICKKPSPPDKPGKRPFIISTDVDIDDWMAILYMHQHPNVDIKAITVCGDGVVYAGPGVRNTQGLLALGWPWDIPVACGARKPLKYNHGFPSSWRMQYSNIMGLTLPHNPFPPSTLPAEDLMIETIKNSREKMNILAIGPLTDLALALKKDRSIIKRIEMVYIMGGAVYVKGNVKIPCQTDIKNECAEFNIYTDPVAAQYVLESGVPITLVPLDACNDVPLDMDFYRLLVNKHNTPQANFVFQALSKDIDFVASGEYYFWDPLAAVIATDPGVISKSEKVNISVNTGDGLQSGCMKKVPGKSNILVCFGACKEKTWTKFLDIINCR